ncbi:hypothetical protein FHY16_001425 [Xanthomonas campestris]|uniref:hypothetical protein n=1 Tax=Xanthomonas euroxanthea TaxID=2259622 RepID=UPI001612E48F|nr:hypothetical protein [Xanthomonas euroxanthea]MBB3778682.1 hypothetical protein [Xanthomonas euroxanthea]
MEGKLQAKEECSGAHFWNHGRQAGIRVQHRRCGAQVEGGRGETTALERRDQYRLEKSDGPVMRNCTRIVAPGGQARAGDAKPWRCNGSTSWALVAVLQGEHCIS